MFSPRNFEAGTWGHMPSGCIVDVGSGDIKFNRQVDGNGHDSFKLVCSDVPEEARSDYRDASKLLCSRKRATCWWNDNPDNCASGFSFGDHLTTNVYWWTEDPCHLQAQVNIDGRVSVVHPGSESIRRVGVNSEGWFLVRWQEGDFPVAASGCGGDDACSVVAGESGPTCLCDLDMTTSAVFTDASLVPTLAEVEEALRIGAPSPDHFATYSMCDTSACQARAPLVTVYTRGSADDPLLDETAIFSIVVNRTASNPSSGRTLYLSNKRSVVTIANATHSAGFSFRNPPQFMTLVDPSQRDALYETEALLDHLFYHQNVPTPLNMPLYTVALWTKKLVCGNSLLRSLQRR